LGAILVVDDDPELNALIQEALLEKGYDVLTAANGREALNRLKDPASYPSLIVLDLMMPMMNGWQVLDIIARDHSLQKIPIILMSAYFGDSFVGDPYTMLPKPFTLDTLLGIVAHHFRERAAGKV
jgi:putative two-component system response regulator